MTSEENNTSNMVKTVYNSLSNISSLIYTNEQNILKDFANNEILQIGNILSGIFDSNTSESFIEPPRLVVVGTQSSGKSSLLNGIISMDIMPVGKNMVTRTPLNLQLTQTQKDSYAEFGNYNNGKWNIENKINLTLPHPTQSELNEISKEINNQTVKRAGEGMNISHDSIILKLYSPNIPNLSLVDLPGITMVACTDKGQPIDIKDQIQTMISKYIDNERSIILAVLPARSDIEADPALELIKRYDNKGVRTVGVFTKIDLMNTGTDITDYLSNNISKDLQFKYGYYAVKNRGPNDINSLSLVESLNNEMNYFDKHPIYSKVITKNRFGTKNLVDNLCNILVNNIRKYLPSILNELYSKKNTIDNSLYSLGPSLPENEEAKVSHLHILIANFCRDFSKAINKRGENINTGRKIKEIFIKYRKDLQSINPFSNNEYPDSYISNAISNYDGNHMSFNTFPIEVLECCLKDHVRKPMYSLLDPSIKCLEEVHSEITLMIENILLDESISRFNHLTDILKDEINKILNNNLLPSNNQIKEKILIEENYIWTDNSDFLNKLSEIVSKHNLTIVEPNIIRELLVEYFKTVIVSSCDQIPKIIMYYFINNTEKCIYSELFKNISKIDVNQLLAESEEISSKRSELMNKKNKIDETIKIIKSF